MKIFVAVLALMACASATDEWVPKTGEQMKEIHHECEKEHPLPPEVKDKMKHLEYPDVEAVHKYIHCKVKKVGIFCDDKGYHAEHIAKQFKMDMEEAEVLKLAQECIDKHPKGDKTVEVAAYEGYKCFMATTVGDKIKEYIKKHHHNKVSSESDEDSKESKEHH